MEQHEDDELTPKKLITRKKIETTPIQIRITGNTTIIDINQSPSIKRKKSVENIDQRDSDYDNSLKIKSNCDVTKEKCKRRRHVIQESDPVDVQETAEQQNSTLTIAKVQSGNRDNVEDEVVVDCSEPCLYEKPGKLII